MHTCIEKQDIVPYNLTYLVIMCIVSNLNFMKILKHVLIICGSSYFHFELWCHAGAKTNFMIKQIETHTAPPLIPQFYLWSGTFGITQKTGNVLV